jgi:hypothetical protein
MGPSTRGPGRVAEPAGGHASGPRFRFEVGQRLLILLDVGAKTLELLMRGGLLGGDGGLLVDVVVAAKRLRGLQVQDAGTHAFELQLRARHGVAGRGHAAAPGCLVTRLHTGLRAVLGRLGVRIRGRAVSWNALFRRGADFGGGASRRRRRHRDVGIGVDPGRTLRRLRLRLGLLGDIGQ